MTPFDIRKYQANAWKILSRSFANDRIASTYLFHGPEGTGRWALAIAFAALNNCLEPASASNELLSPCGECRNCRNVFALNFEGMYFAFPLPPHKNLEEAAELTRKLLDAKRQEPFKILSSTSATNIPIAQAREIRRRLSLRADKEVTRVVVFYEMEKMKEGSADSLLKLIEEPPPDTVLIMIVRRPEVLLPTLQSRAQKIKVSRVPAVQVEKYLTERYAVGEKKAGLLARLSDNSIGKAIELADGDDDNGSSQRAVGFLLFKSLFQDTSYQTTAHINELVDSRNRGNANELLELWQSLLRDCVNYSIVGEEANLMNLDFAGEIRNISGRVGTAKAASLMADEIKNTLEDLRRNAHIQGALTALALKLKSHAGAGRE